nr:O-antigen ligase family protein [Membranihabitans maritimus]
MILNSRLDNYSNFRINNILAWLFITFGTLVLFFTFSRAGIIAALSGTLLVIWPYIEKRIPLKISKKGLYTLLSTIAISAIIGLYLLKKDSADGRLFVWKVSSSLIGDAPFFGHGWGSFDDKYNLYQAQYFDSGQGNSDEKYLSINGVKYPYNESIKWIVENGVVGFGLLILFLVLLYLSFQKVLFSERNNALQFRSILGSLVALFIFSQFSYPSELIFLSVFGPVLLALLGVGETINQKTLLRGNGVIQYGMVTLLLASGFYLGKWTINNRKYAGNWEKAFAAFNEQKYHEANQLYSNSYHQLNDEANFLQQYGKSLSLSSQFDKSNIIMTRAKLYSSDPGIYNTLGYNYFEQGKYQKAELELLQSMSISPYSLYPQYILSKSYFRSNQTDKAVYRAKILLSIEPKIHNDMSNSIRAEMTSFINENK